MQRITVRNARFQQWEALLGNRTKRQRSGQFLVQGVRPITVAVERGWPLDALLVHDHGRLSEWARGLLARAPEVYSLSAELMADLGEKHQAVPEVIAVAQLPGDDLSRVTVGPDFLGVLLDRPASPGNIGSVIRSADAMGAHAVIVTGHAADVYDPRAVRASTGSVFAVPTIRVPGPDPVIDWLRGSGVRTVGTDETGDVRLDEADLTTATLVLVGSEGDGLSRVWRERADQLVRIPMQGSASSLNAANAASIVLYEAARQRL